jgi:hypothetical protein
VIHLPWGLPCCNVVRMTQAQGAAAAGSSGRLAISLPHAFRRRARNRRQRDDVRKFDAWSKRRSRRGCSQGDASTFPTSGAFACAGACGWIARARDRSEGQRSKCFRSSSIDFRCSGPSFSISFALQRPPHRGAFQEFLALAAAARLWERRSVGTQGTETAELIPRARGARSTEPVAKSDYDSPGLGEITTRRRTQSIAAGWDETTGGGWMKPEHPNPAGATNSQMLGEDVPISEAGASPARRSAGATSRREPSIRHFASFSSRQVSAGPDRYIAVDICAGQQPMGWREWRPAPTRMRARSTN